MKKYLTIILALASFVSFGQRKGNVQLYGYKQSVSGGKGPETGGNHPAQNNSAGKNYFLYAASDDRIYPTEVWVEGTRYGVSIKTVEKTPIEYDDGTNIGAPAKVLVPKTKKKIVQLVLIGGLKPKVETSTAGKLAATNALVLVYKTKGKLYQNTLPLLTELQSANRQ